MFVLHAARTPAPPLSGPYCVITLIYTLRLLPAEHESLFPTTAQPRQWTQAKYAFGKDRAKSELREKADFLLDKPARQELPPEMRDEYGKFANILVLFHHDVTVTGCTARDVTSEYIRSYPADHDDL